MPICRLCGASSRFVKSHIIPEAFFRVLRRGGETPLLIAGAVGQVPRQRPIGVYDREILCATCEGKFLQWDTYGIDVLLTRFDHFFKPILNEEKIVGYEASDIDKIELLDFLTSIMWRASVSSQLFYQKVQLGPYEAKIRDCMLAQVGHAPESVDVVFSRWDDGDDDRLPTNGLMNPYLERWDGVNAYRLYLGKIIAYVKFDKRSFGETFAKFSLRNSEHLRIISRSLAESKDLVAMQETALASHRNLAVLRNRKSAI